MTTPNPALRPEPVEILTELTANTGEEYHKLHSGKQTFELTNGRMKYYESRAIAALNQYILQEIISLIGSDEVSVGLAMNTAGHKLVARNELRSELRHAAKAKYQPGDKK